MALFFSVTCNDETLTVIGFRGVGFRIVGFRGLGLSFSVTCNDETLGTCVKICSVGLGFRAIGFRVFFNMQ